MSLCFEKGVQVSVLSLPEELDPDSFIQKHGIEKYNQLLDKSAHGLDFMIDTFLIEGRLDIAEEKSLMVKKVVKEIEKIPDSIVRSEYLKHVSERLSVSEEVVRNIIKQKSSEEEEPEGEGFLDAEKRLLQILIENSFIAPYVYKEMKEEDIRGLKGEPIFKILSECYQKGKAPNFHDFKQKVDPSTLSLFSKALQEHQYDPTLEEAMSCLDALKLYSFDKQAEEIKLEIRKFEKIGENEKINQLYVRLDDIKKQSIQLKKRNYQNISNNK